MIGRLSGSLEHLNICWTCLESLKTGTKGLAEHGTSWNIHGKVTSQMKGCMMYVYIYIYTDCVCIDMYIYIIIWEGIRHSIRERQIFLPRFEF